MLEKIKTQGTLRERVNEIKRREVRLMSSKERKDPEKEKIVLMGTYFIK